MKISKFKLDRIKKIFELKKDLMKFIEDFTNEINLYNSLKKFSKCYNLHFESLQFEEKQFLFKNFINKKGVFDSKFKFSKVFKSSIVYLLFLIYVIIFSKTKKIKQLTTTLLSIIILNLQI